MGLEHRHDETYRAPSLEVEVPRLLARPLEPLELDLLEAVWDPVWRGTSDWPVWDYVSRILYRSDAEVIDAEALLAGLPQIHRMVPTPQSPPYGLIWVSDHERYMRPDSTVGLTAAGMLRLAERRPELNHAAAALFQIMKNLANWEKGLIPDPMRAVNPTMPIATLIDGVTLPDPARGVAPLPREVVFSVLRHEAVPLNLNSNTGGGGEPTVWLTPYLRPLLPMTAAQEYVDYLEQLHDQRELRTPLLRSDDLPRAIDYASHVIASLPAANGVRLLPAPGLEVVAEMSMSVSSKAEFDRAMSSLKTVFDSLKAPLVKDDVLRSHGVDPAQAPSLRRLAVWLQETLTDTADRQAAAAAVKVLQDVVALRTQAQHSGRNLRERAAAACGRLGLPYPIRDWQHAWDVARARAADAFDTIRRVVARANGGDG